MKAKFFFGVNFAIWVIRNLQTFLLPKVKNDFTIVSASDYTHQESLANLIESLVKHEPDSRVIIYDLGIEGVYLQKLMDRFPKVEFRRFPFELFPNFFQMRQSAGSYAWKPAAIKLSIPSEGYALWLDAGNVITGKLQFLRRVVRKYGFYSPFSADNIQDWTFPQLLMRLKVAPEILNKRNLGANVVAFDSKSAAGLSLINTWAEFSKDKSLIAPIGSDRSNHRQDQSLLSVLAYQHEMVTYGSLGDFHRRVFKIKVHQDVE